uniref:Uncharacterized protein n=1 Tax=Rhizophora mucronata TaxID=61149 RepID=A0A2P2PB28_RHIMU
MKNSGYGCSLLTGHVLAVFLLAVAPPWFLFYWWRYRENKKGK